MMFSELKHFIFLEKAHDRYDAIKNVVQRMRSWQSHLLTWQILSLLPTSKEKSTLARSLNIGSQVGSEWTILSYLLQHEEDDEVLKECILNSHFN